MLILSINNLPSLLLLKYIQYSKYILYFIICILNEIISKIYTKSAYGKTYNFTQQEKNTLKEIGGLSGAISSLIVGKVKGLDNEEIVDNIFNGQRLGKNAVENNFLYKDIVDATLEYRDFKELVNNDDSKNDNETIPREIENVMYLGEKSEEILDKLPEVDIMDVNVDASLSIKDGLNVSAEVNVLNISNKSGSINVSFGSADTEIYANKDDGIGIGAGVDIVKVEFTHNGITYEANYGYGGGVSTKNPKPEFSLGLSFDAGLQF